MADIDDYQPQNGKYLKNDNTTVNVAEKIEAMQADIGLNKASLEEVKTKLDTLIAGLVEVEGE